MRRPQAVSSLLDTDFYKYTMCQLAWRRHRGVRVKYAFTNRTKGVNLAERLDIDELREQLESVRNLRFHPEELDWLARGRHTAGLFDPEFIAFLADLRLPEISVERDGGTFRIVTEGPWCEAIWWETPVLSTIAEEFASVEIGETAEAHRRAYDEGVRRLDDKIKTLHVRPDARVIEFGTRRRASGAWQEVVLGELSSRLPPGMLLGTSNVALARRYGLKPIGTMAHETFMVYSGIYRSTFEEMLGSHNRVLRDWQEDYPEALRVALTDTWGSDFFFRDMTAEQARAWKGLRQDSGDPAYFGERAIAFYKGHGIDPTTKSVTFSDGLDVDAIVRLQARFEGRIGVAFGWGTNLTNDIGLKTLSLVMKAVEADGQPLVKLSDTIAKATGPKDLIERIAAAVGYDGGQERELIS